MMFSERESGGKRSLYSEHAALCLFSQDEGGRTERKSGLTNSLHLLPRLWKKNALRVVEVGQPSVLADSRKGCIA